MFSFERLDKVNKPTKNPKVQTSLAHPAEKNEDTKHHYITRGSNIIGNIDHNKAILIV